MASSLHVEFVDAIAQLADGRYVNISEWAEWDSKDTTIATCYMGRVDARNSGETEITVSYNGFSKTINVIVLEGICYLNNAEMMASSTQDDCITRANACTRYLWTATQYLAGWKNNNYNSYYEGQTYQGLPYSQTYYQSYPIVYDFAPISFPLKLNADDFYDRYTVSEIIMPKYGLDCSGFLSYCWGIERKCTNEFRSYLYYENSAYTPVGNYNPADVISYNSATNKYVISIENSSRSTIRNAYTSLEQCDGLVNNGHCMFVLSNNISEEFIMVDEQTPPLTKRTIFTYDTLLSQGYLPFAYVGS